MNGSIELMCLVLRGTLRYSEAIELADALSYDIIWRAKECGMPLSSFRCRAEIYEKAKLL